MKTRIFSLIAVCTALTACNSGAPEPAPTASPSTATEVVAPTPAPTAAIAPEAIKPAPEGLPSRIAGEVISGAGLTCASVTEANRDAADGTITATCAGGEKYRVFTVDGQGPTATKL